MADTLHLSRLCTRLGYSFEKSQYLKQALTHRSANSEHNERFEFLGDACLSAIISSALYTQFPNKSEGELSRLRANLVNGEMLANIATELQLGDCLILGQGELKSGGFRRASILADALEAILAAIYLDGGFDACQQVVLHLYKTRLESGLQDLHSKDAKTRLQEYLQAQKLPLPEYTLVNMIEHESESVFDVTCQVKKLDLMTKGQGETRRKAEQKAAEKLLHLLKT
jgi:ribonuclease-3